MGCVCEIIFCCRYQSRAQRVQKRQTEVACGLDYLLSGNIALFLEHRYSAGCLRICTLPL